MEEEAIVPTRSLPNILITGTPGSGKTTLSKILEDALSEYSYKYINVGTLIQEHRLYDTWNEEFNVSEFDEDKVLDFIEENFDINTKGALLFEFHSSNFFPKRYFDLVVLLRCGNEELSKRLEGRGYALNKIQENVSCEILEVTHDEVFESYDEEIILELQNNVAEDVEKNKDIILQWLGQWWKNKAQNK